MNQHRNAVIAAALMSASLGAQSGLEYPMTRTVEHVDTYHGTTVHDPYRWLEDDMSPETATWVEAQNRVTFAYLERHSGSSALKDRLQRCIDYPRYAGALHETRPGVLLQERRAAESERALRPEGARRHAGGVDRSEHVVGATGPSSWSALRRLTMRDMRCTASRRAVRTGWNTTCSISRRGRGCPTRSSG